MTEYLIGYDPSRVGDLCDRCQEKFSCRDLVVLWVATDNAFHVDCFEDEFSIDIPSTWTGPEED